MAGFIQEKIKISTPIVPTDFRHALCIGETGCGKTTSFILPNIIERMKDDYGMLVIDFKGNLHAQVKVLAERENRLDDIFEVGVPWGSQIGMFKNISKSTFLDTLNEVNGDEGERFWITSALNIAGQIYDVISIMNSMKDILKRHHIISFDYDISPKSFNKIMAHHKSFDKFLSSFFDQNCKLKLKLLLELREKGVSERDLYLISQFKKEIDKLYLHLFSFHSSIDKDSPASGSGGVFFSLRNILNTFSDSSLNGTHDIKSYLEAGKIVILRSDTYDENITKAIMNLLYKQLLQRNNDKKISLFVDEFHRTVSKNNIPFIDLFREMKVELIAAMQNIEQLENKITLEKSNEFMGNILYNFNYADHRENTLKTFEFTYNGEKLEAKPIFISKTQIYKTQFLWQKISGNELPKNWIYLIPDGYKRAIILNTKTKTRKHFYILDKEDTELAKAFAKPISNNYAHKIAS